MSALVERGPVDRPISRATVRSTRDRNAWARVRICCDCGKVQSVRRDNTSERCQSCAARISGAKGLATIRARARPKPPVKPRISRRIDRICQMCGATFSVLKSALSGRTNASGNFCTRPCYDRWLAGSTVYRDRGSDWPVIARWAIQSAPFCAWCGRLKVRLDAHHIVPFRISGDNCAANLIPLCNVCHKRIETAVKTLESAGGPECTLPLLGVILRRRQQATAAHLRRIAHAHR